MALLDVDVRRKRFGDRDVLADLHLRVAAGEIVSLVGASGCGKSTLLRLVAGLDRDFAGRIALDGVPVDGPTRDIRFVFQEPRLFPWLNVADNVAFDLGGGAAVGPRVTPCSPKSASPAWPTACRSSSRAARRSASRSRAGCWCGRGCCCSTNPSPPSMRSPGWRCRSCCSASPRPTASPCCSSRTTSTRRCA